MLALANEPITERKKLKMFLIFLEEAQKKFLEIQAKSRITYPSVCKELCANFGTDSNSAKVEWHTLSKFENEIFSDFAIKIKVLVKEAYTDLNQDEWKSLFLDKFIE